MVKIIFFIAIYRLLNGLIICTTYNPDEYWQSLEIAYRIVNKYGYLTWEWEPCISLRNIVHPLIFSPCYYLINLLKWLRMFENFNFRYYYFPRLYQSIFGILTDIGTSKVMFLLYQSHFLRLESDSNYSGEKNNIDEFKVLKFLLKYQRMCSKYKLDFIAFFISLTSWYNFFTLCRTYSQTLECCLNIWSIYFMMKSLKMNSASKEERGNSIFSKYPLFFGILISSLSVLVRHSSAQFWFLFYLILLMKLALCPKELEVLSIRKFLSFLISIVVFGILVMVSTDYWFYQKFTIPLINFVKFNLIGDPGIYFGTNSKFYYFTEAPLVTMLSFLPFLLLGIYESLVAKKQSNTIFECSQVSTFFTIILLSFASHKEYRFLIPYFPIIIVTASIGFHKVVSETISVLKKGKKDYSSWIYRVMSRLILNKHLFILVLVIQVIPALYFTTSFQRGGEIAIRTLSRLDLKNSDSIFFLHQCHMYPTYSYLNKDVEIGFFDCSPTLNPQFQNYNNFLWKHPNPEEFLEQVFVTNSMNSNSPCYSPYVSPVKSQLESNNSDFKNCLNYRFTRRLCGHLPTYFVVNSYFNDKLQFWLKFHGYIQTSKIFDSIISETPIGYMSWSYLYIYKKKES
ncbi:GPI mannosyltransferase 3 [Cryptosporidium felis]|nr:GPI mannosyltransferase 3 [Cryptosporidium felis]